MIKGLRGATISSQELNNLLTIYSDELGQPVLIQLPGFVVLGSAGAPTLALGTHSEVRGRNAAQRGVYREIADNAGRQEIILHFNLLERQAAFHMLTRGRMLIDDRQHRRQIRQDGDQAALRRAITGGIRGFNHQGKGVARRIGTQVDGRIERNGIGIDRRLDLQRRSFSAQ